MKLKEPGVTWFEDKADTVKLVGEIVAAGVGILACSLKIASSTRSLRFKRSDPEAYWEMKRKDYYNSSKVVADSVNNLADSVIDLSNSINSIKN